MYVCMYVRMYVYTSRSLCAYITCVYVCMCTFKNNTVLNSKKNRVPIEKKNMHLDNTGMRDEQHRLARMSPQQFVHQVRAPLVKLSRFSLVDIAYWHL